jgi:hypothetical protein
VYTIDCLLNVVVHYYVLLQLQALYSHITLYDLQLKFFTLFKEKYPNNQMMFTKFQSLKPWFVKTLCECNTCCCRYHIEISELKEGLNGMRTQGKGMHGGYTCSCTKICCLLGKNICPPRKCEAHVSCFKRLTSLWSSIL